MKYTKLNCLFIALFFSCVLSIKAQEKPEVKEQETKEEKPNAEELFLVTATKTQTEAREIGKSFTVITRQEIERSNHNDLLNMLQRVPGLAIAKNGPHGNASVFIRGNESHYTKLMINGTRIQDASSTQVGIANVLNNLNLDNVERIEIIRGPQSVLYGSSAIGGVINIITRKGKENGINGSIRQEFGEDEFSKSTLSVRGKEGEFTYSMSLSQEQQNSISGTNSNQSNYESDGDDYRNTTANYDFGYNFTDSIEFKLSGLYTSSNNEIDAFTPYDENDLQTATVRPSLTFYDLLDGKLTTEIAYNFVDTRRSATSGYNSYSKTQMIELQNTLYLSDWNTLTFGADLSEEEANSDSPSASTVTNKVRYQEYYVQEQLSFEDMYFLTFGARYSDHSEFGDEWTYQIAPAIYFDETGTKLHASFGTAYRAPSSFELFNQFAGNPNLSPETNQSFDIGFEQELKETGFSFGATYFYIETDDKIIYDFSTSKYAQVSNARSYGAETFVQYDFNEDLYGKIIYTRTHTENSNANGDFRAARVPKDAGTLLVNWQATNKLNFDVEVNVSGNRFSDTNNNTSLGSFTVANLAANYDFNEKLKFFAKIDNIFDEDYEYVDGYNTYGRSFYGGIEFKF
ncbi:MAG: TonB-dependent receptor [Lentisphaeraceae bacterium]|nr:TonB-dependent receptor [Lentisphaeraceae bacterium]